MSPWPRTAAAQPAPARRPSVRDRRSDDGGKKPGQAPVGRTGRQLICLRSRPPAEGRVRACQHPHAMPIVFASPRHDGALPPAPAWPILAFPPFLHPPAGAGSARCSSPWRSWAWPCTRWPANSPASACRARPMIARVRNTVPSRRQPEGAGTAEMPGSAMRGQEAGRHHGAGMQRLSAWREDAGKRAHVLQPADGSAGR